MLATPPWTDKMHLIITGVTILAFRAKDLKNHSDQKHTNSLAQTTQKQIAYKSLK